MTALDELSAAARSIAASVTPSLVGIGRPGDRSDDPRRRHHGRPASRGTGLVIAGGKVLTSAHNLRDRTTTVTFVDGRSVQGELAGADLDGDVVILNVDTAAVPAIELSASAADVGDIVFSATAGGHVTFGMISASGRTFRGPRGRLVRGAIEHTASVPRGGSGGLLLNASGKVVGINTHRIEGGFYLAVPTDVDLLTRLARMSEGEVIERRRLGVALVPSHIAQRIRAAAGLPEQPGVLVRGVGEDTPASRAGIKRGDVITAVNGTPITHPDQLAELLDASAADTLTLAIVSGTESKDVTVSFT